MIARCLACHAPTVPHCLCGKNVVRCPVCQGTGMGKEIELLEDFDGYLGYVTVPTGQRCGMCDGNGKVQVIYKKLER